MMHSSRRQLYATALTLVLSLVFTIAADAAEKVNFRLDFKLSGPHVPFFWALEKGYFASEGLDVDIKEGAGAQQTINLIAAKQDDLAIGDFLVLANAVSKGAPVEATFGYVQKNAWAVISFDEAGIRKPQDLIGRSVAVIADHKSLLELFLRANNVPPDAVTIRVVNVAARNAVFAERKVDAFVSQVLGSPVDFIARAQEGKGKPVKFMLFSDFGIKSLSQGLLAHPDYLAQKPDVVRKFIRAVARSIKEISQPRYFEEAADIAIRRTSSPVDRRESIKLQWQETVKFIRFEDTAERPFGWMAKEDWQDTVDVLLKTGQIEKSPPLEKLYTNDFIR
jgi:NitT/TauT family transport system substrate-binding protein